VDKDNDGRIDYEEFCSMMRQGNEEVRGQRLLG
jgi:calcium-dependent protein kinase